MDVFFFHGALRPQKPYGLSGTGEEWDSPGPPPCSLVCLQVKMKQATEARSRERKTVSKRSEDNVFNYFVFFPSTLPPKCVCILNSVSFVVAAAVVVINGGQAYQ